MILVGFDEVAMAAIILGISSGTLITLVKIWVNRPSARPPAISPEMDDRLLRIEQAVDAIAIEVERMSESQRFTSKVLAERLPSSTALPGSTARGST